MERFTTFHVVWVGGLACDGMVGVGLRWGVGDQYEVLLYIVRRFVVFSFGYWYCEGYVSNTFRICYEYVGGIWYLVLGLYSLFEWLNGTKVDQVWKRVASCMGSWDDYLYGVGC